MTRNNIHRWVWLASVCVALVSAGCGDDDGAPDGCGDGVPVLPEMCDDGNTIDNDGCSATCQVENGYVCWDTPSICRNSCGDGIVANVEECDDGNPQQGDGCSNNCVVEYGWECNGEPSTCDPVCGDGQVIDDEACDDGNLTAGDGCAADCTVESGYVCDGVPSACYGVCGNGGMTPDEGCDDSNQSPGDGCGVDCQIESGWECNGEPSSCTTVCGDSITAGTEECDDGVESASCDDDCTLSACGDGEVNAAAGEDCDDSGQTATCDDDCTTPVCGDGLINGAAAEVCDDGDVVTGDGCGDTCAVEAGWYCNGEPSNCTTQCGDGTMAGLEGCDDGNTVDCDGCAADCTVEPMTNCGDGALECGEQCDDGNAVTGDGCASCVVEAGWNCSGTPSTCTSTCGDGVRVGTEQCDDGNTVDCDGCSATCANEAVPNCGDGSQVCGEQCDDGNNVDGDGCSAICVIEFCGDGILHAGLGEICDEAGDTVTCDGDCTPVACGDGYMNVVIGETCDDGNLVSGDGCDAACQSECITQTEAIRITEMNIGGSDYLVLTNGAVCSHTLAGLELRFVDSDSTSFPAWNLTLPSQTLLAGESVYVVESAPSGTDIDTGQNIGFSGSRGGWVALCNGTCSGTDGTNIIDAFAFDEGQVPLAMPSPVVFSPGGVTGIISEDTNSYFRSTYTGANPTFLQADWIVAPATR